MNLGFYKESDFHYMTVGYKSHTIYVVNQEENKTLGQGLFYSKDDGKTWSPSQLNGLPQTSAGTIAAHPTDENMVGISTPEGIFVSKDNGNTFERFTRKINTTTFVFQEKSITLYFPWLRKLIGPILILVGLYLLGIFKMYWNVTLFKVPERFLKKGKIGSFLMDFGFSLAFCPTMFVLFFVTLMPLVYSTSYGVLLPSIFAVGTSVPVIFFIFILWYLGFNGTLMKKGRQAGSFVQKAAGIMMILIGILDTITYWF
ncbi:hypothetical protein GCA01S_082_00040 [Parageobacillus caldoxylosilyticus NBRC 107762]|uniref:Urease accessory protein UreH-like transmembrane domain-containing protein n=2 Tax=Saccharococcus caldoxylosilyticus TaxID=81408 RepID=A0A023DK28_9BACL|nr:hypothetical protein GCA01S_082_00040 [Parageobacillus caldoxylosilyticus NBRC 107762]